jgi:uncharacterized protein
MSGEKDIEKLLKSMKPECNVGDYVFCHLDDLAAVDIRDVILLFREREGVTVIIRKELADQLHLEYSFVATWITLTVHSSLEGVGLTAAFSNALAENGISCNVVAAYYHDHIFVDKKDAEKAIAVLTALSEQ